MKTHKFDITIDIAGAQIAFACEAEYTFWEGRTSIRNVTGRRLKTCTKTLRDMPHGDEIDLTAVLNCGALQDEITALEEQERAYARESAASWRYDREERV